MIKIYTDGSCYPNPGPAGWAYVVTKDDDLIFEQSGQLEEATNNIVELLAIENALLHARQKGYDNVLVYTDSEYSMKSIVFWAGVWKRNNWYTRKGTKVKNKELIERIYYLYEAMNKFKQSCHIKWIRGHNGNKFNELADELAGKKRNHTRTY